LRKAGVAGSRRPPDKKKGGDVEKIYFGLDVGGRFHRLCFLDEDKNPLGRELTISDDLEGFEALGEEMEKLRERYPEAAFHGGAEATGIYWRNIFSFFRRCLPWVKLSLLNPLQTRRFRELELNRVKTDSTDARSIARFVATFEPPAAPDLPAEYLDLCELCRFRKLKVAEHARYLNHLHRYLKQAFPELCGKVKRGAGLRYLALLMHFPTAYEVRRAEVSEIASLTFGKKDSRLGEKFAREAKELAVRSCASQEGPGIGFALRSIAANLLRIREELSALEEKIAELYQAFPATPLFTIPGISPLQAAVMEAEIKSVGRFPSAKHLVGYVGAYPELRESGDSRLGKPRMTRKGNRYLNQAVYLSVLAAISPRSPDNTIKHFYWSKVAEGKERMVALGSAMRKLTHIIYGVLMSGKPYDPAYEYPEEGFEVRFVDREKGCFIEEKDLSFCEKVMPIRYKRATAPRPHKAAARGRVALNQE